MNLQGALLRYFRIPIRGLMDPNKIGMGSGWMRSMSSHGDDHLSKEEVTDRILSVVKSFPKVNSSSVTPEVHFQNDLGLDSLDNVEIVMAIEEEFKLEIPDKEADKIDSCKLAIEYVYNHPMSS